MDWVFETEKTLGRGGKLRGDYFAICPDDLGITDGGVFIMVHTNRDEKISFWLSREDSEALARRLVEQYGTEL